MLHEVSDNRGTPERRAEIQLSAEQIDAIAEAAAQRALEKVYQEVGKSAVKLVLWVIGSSILALLAYLGAKEGLRMP